MIVLCQCGTAAGLRCSNGFRGPRAKARFERVCNGGTHAQPMGECDICKVRSKVKVEQKGDWWFTEVPGWVKLETGRMLPQYTEADVRKIFPVLGESIWGAAWVATQEGKREQERAAYRLKVRPEEIHVCPECAAALRQSQQIAFDVCCQQRQNLNAGLFPSTETPPRTSPPSETESTP